MTELFEDKGELCGVPITIQGIFEDGECVACKVLDGEGEPVSWAFDMKTIGGPRTNTMDGFYKTIQHLYDREKQS